MKQKIVLALLLMSTISSFSQNSKFGIEANYPMPMGRNFISQNYIGVIDVGVKYKFINLKSISIGTGINGGILFNHSHHYNQNIRVVPYVIQPKIFAELNLASIPKFHSFVGFGYTFIIFDVSGTVDGKDMSGENMAKSGMNANFGITYDITKKLFVQAQYDFIKLDDDGGIPATKYNTNVNIFKIGLGYRFMKNYSKGSGYGE